MIARLVTFDEAGGERLLGEYTFNHTRSLPGPGRTVVSPTVLTAVINFLNSSSKSRSANSHRASISLVDAGGGTGRVDGIVRQAVATRRYEIGSRGDERNAFKALEQDTEQTPPSPFHREASHAQQREQSRGTEDNLWFPIRSE
jgi:hypothetical protein